MFSQLQQAKSCDILKPGWWLINDWDAGLLVIKQPDCDEDCQGDYLCILLNRQGEALAQCCWHAADTETFAEPIRVLRDGEQQESHIIRYVPAGDC